MDTLKRLAEWYIEWDAWRIFVTHAPCGKEYQIDQGPGSPFFLDDLARLVEQHDDEGGNR